MAESRGIDNGSLMEEKAKTWRQAKRIIKGLTQEEAEARIEHIKYALHQRASNLKQLELLVAGEREGVAYLQEEFIKLQKVLTPIIKVKLKTRKKPSNSLWAEAQDVWDSLSKEERASVLKERKEKK